MNNKILIAAFVGLSVLAAAQSQTDTQTKSSKSQPGGRSDQKNVVHRDLAARDLATGHATGKKTAQDDWSQRTAVSTGKPAGAKPVSSASDTKASSRVAAGDVNGDGVADVAAGKSSAHATEALAATANSPARVQAPRDISTGHASGKRQHQPVIATQTSDKSSNQ